MVSPHPLSWADAPPYHYHGTTLPAPAPAKDDAGGGGAVAGQDVGARSLWIGGLLHWMNEDYLSACFTYSPEVLVPPSIFQSAKSTASCAFFTQYCLIPFRAPSNNILLVLLPSSSSSSMAKGKHVPFCSLIAF
jgi:hypothetical protein